MSDPLSHDTHPGAAALSGADSCAQIEGLLLTGLDHYFAARYDQAIHVWTRVLFLDRGHARARAYIERARRAQAERQRETEALLHDGTDAFQRGDASAARRLLRSAVERGAPDDAALAMLGRLDRLEASAPPVVSETRTRRPPGTRAASGRARAGRPDAVPRWGTLAVVFASLLVTAALAVAIYSEPIAEWLLFERVERAAASGETDEVPLPIPSTAEAALARARTLAERGRLGHDGSPQSLDQPRLREALRALDVIRAGDPLRAEADVLRAAIQHALLATVETGSGGPAGPPQ